MSKKKADPATRESRELKFDIEATSHLKMLYGEKFCDEALRFLVAGLLSDSRILRDHSVRAVTAFGSAASARLTEIIILEQLSAAQARRVRQIIASTRDLPRQSQESSELLFGLILLAAKHDNTELLKQGLSLSRYLRRRMLSDYLVDEAIRNQADKKFFRRLLNAVVMSREQPSQDRCLKVTQICISTTGSLSRSCRGLIEAMERGELEDPFWQQELSSRHLSREDLARWPEMQSNTDQTEELCKHLSRLMWSMGYHPCPVSMVKEALADLDQIA